MQNRLMSWLKSITVYRRLLDFSRQYVLIFILGAIGTVAVSLVDAGFMWLLKPIMNKGIIGRDAHFLHWLPILIISAFVLRGMATFVSSYFINLVSRNVVRDFRRQLFSKYLLLPSSFFDANNSGRLLSTIIYNVEQVSEASSTALLILLRESTYLIGLIIVMFVVSWQLSLFFLLVAPVISVVIYWSAKRMQHLSDNVQKSVGEATLIADEGIKAHRIIKLYDGVVRETKRFFDVTARARHREMKVVVTNTVSTATVQIALGVPIAAVLYFATLPSMHISAGSFTAVVTAMISILRPFRRLTSVNSSIQRGVAGAKSIFTILDEPVEVDAGMRRLSHTRGDIAYKDVSFAYDSQGAQVLSHINLQVQPQQVVALVGHSGAGKSTLVNMLPRFYLPTSGGIFLDDVNIKDYSLADLRRQISFVSQYTILFDDTVFNNIAYGCPGEVTLQQVEAAADAANALSFIRELPEGMYTSIGEDGVMLSGGQRQRISIARALLKNAPILILDEATSSLDTQSEKIIQEAISGLMHNRTTLVIAHRLSTIEHADSIVVLDHGVVVESGAHVHLLEQQGAYSDLYAAQFGEAEAAVVVE